jgi:uncharacterized protein YbcI
MTDPEPEAIGTGAKMGQIAHDGCLHRRQNPASMQSPDGSGGPDLRALTGEGTNDTAGGVLNAEIARAVVRTYREFRGRGPTKARALYRDNIVVVVLQDVMTTSERSLATHGWAGEGLETRRQLHSLMCPALTAAVEDLTGSRVVAVMGDSHQYPDMSVEVFVLEDPVGPRRSAAPDGRFRRD